jgi:hypothetical protein
VMDKRFAVLYADIHGLAQQMKQMLKQIEALRAELEDGRPGVGSSDARVPGARVRVGVVPAAARAWCGLSG